MSRGRTRLPWRPPLLSLDYPAPAGRTVPCERRFLVAERHVGRTVGLTCVVGGSPPPAPTRGSMIPNGAEREGTIEHSASRPAPNAVRRSRRGTPLLDGLPGIGAAGCSAYLLPDRPAEPAARDDRVATGVRDLQAWRTVGQRRRGIRGNSERLRFRDGAELPRPTANAARSVPATAPIDAERLAVAPDRSTGVH